MWWETACFSSGHGTCDPWIVRFSWWGVLGLQKAVCGTSFILRERIVVTYWHKRHVRYLTWYYTKELFIRCLAGSEQSVRLELDEKRKIADTVKDRVEYSSWFEVLENWNKSSRFWPGKAKRFELHNCSWSYPCSQSLFSCGRKAILEIFSQNIWIIYLHLNQ